MGAAIAARLSADGYAVAIADLPSERLTATVEAVRALGVRLFTNSEVSAIRGADLDRLAGGRRALDARDRAGEDPGVATQQGFFAAFGQN